MKEADKALADYNKALELNPKDAVAYNNRGLVHHERGELDKALADYSMAITLDPTNPTFYENRALILAAKGLTPKAAEDYKKALKLTTDEAHRSALLEKLSGITSKNSETATGASAGLPEPLGTVNPAPGNPERR
jgi:tetratricopeptide (TPR) repeat protein